MKSWLAPLASLKLSVALLVALLVALSAGTIVESYAGTAVAGRTVYYALWFQILLAVFAVNVVASISIHFPWGKWRVGFVMTHTALLVILGGALVSFVAKTEGHLPIWEGEQNATFVEQGPDAAAPEIQHQLPFTVALDDFQIDYYQGTHRPAMFRSLVRVVDTERGTNFPAIIQMNQPLTYRGYSLFQSSYEMGQGRDRTVLAVSKDPGQGIVFLGYTLLLVGMTTVLVTRMIQARATAALRSRSLNVVPRVAVIALAAVLSALAAAPARASNWADPGTVDAVGRMAVQHDGRVMPVDTYARETVKFVTGKRSWNGESQVLTVLGWSFDPDRAANEPLVALGRGEFASACGLPAGSRYASFAQLVGNPRAMELIRQARAEAEADRHPSGVLAQAEKIEQRLVAMQEFLRRQAWTVIPNTQDRSAVWGVPPVRSADDLVAVAATPPAGVPAASVLDREITYNAVRPTRIAWIVLALSLVVSIAAFQSTGKALDRIALAGLIVGVAVMSWGIGTRWIVAGRIPAANMFESLLFLAWGVGAFALIAFAVLKNRLVVVNATAMSALTMALTDLLPIDGFIHPVAPVLAGTPWLAIHVPIIMISYSVLALGVVIAHMQIGFTIFKPGRRELIARMSELLYWYAHVGSILLIAGIITGSIWASSSWGRYWGWDPKEVWSLVAFLAYVAILHGRVDRFIGSFGVAAISIIAFQTILMTYLGVNFVLSSGMHSYAFGDSPVLGWMALVALLEGVFLLAGLWAHRRSARKGPELVAA